MVDHQVTRRVELRVVGRQGLEPCTRGFKDVGTVLPGNVRAAQVAGFVGLFSWLRHPDYAGLLWALPPGCHQKLGNFKLRQVSPETGGRDDGKFGGANAG
jgi:hypothetical protein